jgi:hypothetical protein
LVPLWRRSVKRASRSNALGAAGSGLILGMNSPA